MEFIVQTRDLRAEQNITIIDQEGARSNRVTNLFSLVQDLSSPAIVRLQSGGPSVTFETHLGQDGIETTFNTWLVAPYSFLKQFGRYELTAAIVKRAAFHEKQKIVLELLEEDEEEDRLKVAIIEGLSVREFLSQRRALFGIESAKAVPIFMAKADDWNESRLFIKIAEDQPQEEDYSAIEAQFTDTPSSAPSSEPSLIVVDDFLYTYPPREGWAFYGIELSKSDPNEKQTITVTFSKERETTRHRINNKTLQELCDNCQILFGVPKIEGKQISIPSSAQTPRPTPTPTDKPAPGPAPKKVTDLSNRKFFIAIPIVLLSTTLLLLYLNREAIQVWPTKNKTL